MKMCTPMFVGAPPPKCPGNQPTTDESSISKWNKDTIYYSMYLMDLCVPWLEDSPPLFERSTNGFCSLINEWSKTSAIFIEHQRFCVLSNFMTNDIGVVIMKLQLLHGNNKMLIGGQK
jgi:hypothetical protein